MSNSTHQISLLTLLTLVCFVFSAVGQSAAQTATQPTNKTTKPSGVTSPVETQNEPKVEPKNEPATKPSLEPASGEKPVRSEVESVPTPAERLREQLQVVEQMAAAGMRREAIAELQQLSAEDRFDPQGFYNIANALARLEATDPAINTYRKAIEQRKGHYSRASNNLGVVLLRQGFWDQAYEAFLSALRAENFHYAEASYNLGRLYAARGEMERAMREWRRAVAVDPTHEAAARALVNAGSVSSPPAEVNAASKESSGVLPPRNEKPASIPSESRFTVDAETYALLQRGRTAHERRRYEEAVSNFRNVIKRMGGYFSPANLELSYSLMELRRIDEAIASLLLVAQKDGARLPISYYHLGRLYELHGDLKEAEDYYTRAAQSYQTENSQFLLNLSGVREKRGNFSGALAAMEDYIKRKEQQGRKPEWSDSRLASLREKAVAAKNPPKQ